MTREEIAAVDAVYTELRHTNDRLKRVERNVKIALILFAVGAIFGLVNAALMVVIARHGG